MLNSKSGWFIYGHFFGSNTYPMYHVMNAFTPCVPQLPYPAISDILILNETQIKHLLSFKIWISDF